MNRLRIPGFQLLLGVFVLGLTVAVTSAADLKPDTSQQQGTVDFGVESVSYISSTTNVSFLYPTDWEVQNNLFNSVPYTRIENVAARDLTEYSAQHGHFKIEILAFPDNGLSLDAWVDKQNQQAQPGLKVLERKEIDVAGERAISQLEEYANHNHISRAIFVAKGDEVYILNFSNDKQESQRIIAAFLSSFHFNPSL